jgi:peptidoglycan-N-acetylglucosamine deacetylase
MPWLLVGVGVAAFLLYAPLPDLWGRVTGNSVRQGDSERREMALTFDDGHDPRYTPRVLEVLQERGVSATFFLVGEQVRRYPELARRIVAESHSAGTHTLSHRHAYLLGPRATSKEVEGGRRVCMETLGEAPRWFRPPWGALNAWTRRAALRSGQRVALWSITGKDWRARETPASIARRVVERFRPGAIVLLHDSGGAQGAPARMLAALPAILDAAAAQGYTWRRLDDLVGASSLRPWRQER